jgi:hypothetical protein
VAAILLWGTIHYLFSKAAYARSIDGLARYNTTSRTWLADTSSTNQTASASGNSTDIAEHDDDELALSLTLVVYELFLCPYDERRTPFLWVFAIHYQAALSTLALLVFRSCAYVLFGVVVAWQREALAPDLLRKVFPITLLPPEPMVEVKESSKHFRVTMLVTNEDAAAASSSQVAPKLEKLRHKSRKLLAAHKRMLESDILKQAGGATMPLNTESNNPVDLPESEGVTVHHSLHGPGVIIGVDPDNERGKPFCVRFANGQVGRPIVQSLASTAAQSGRPLLFVLMLSAIRSPEVNMHRSPTLDAELQCHNAWIPDKAHSVFTQ